MLDELPSLEFAATAVAVVLALRSIMLWRKVGLVRGRTRIESARARDLIGLAILVGALVYAVRVERASTWFLIAVGVAVVAQLLGFSHTIKDFRIKYMHISGSCIAYMCIMYS